MKANTELTTPNRILVEGWRLTKAILALKGLKVPDIIDFQIGGADHIRATRVAKLEELAKATAALEQGIEHLSEDEPTVTSLHVQLEVDQLNHQRNALVALQDRASRSGASASTTVIEALFPEVLVKKGTQHEKAELERWRALRKQEGLRINPETAEVYSSYQQTLDPYGVLDEWELPEEFDQVGREYFARAPGSDIWVAFGDLPRETREKLRSRQSRKRAFPAGLEGLPDIDW
jgi:hypothetical protein